MHTRYLEEDLEGDELLVAFLEEDSKDAALPHLVQDADTHRGGSDGQQHQQKADLVMLFTAEWGKCCGSGLKELGFPFRLLRFWKEKQACLGMV